MPQTLSPRAYWCDVAARLASPVLKNLQAGTLRKNMPVESSPDMTDRADFTHLEAVGRLLTGLAPWLELGEEPAARDLAALARVGIASIVNPDSPDFGNFTKGHQPLVDAAFLAQALLRAPQSLWEPLDGKAKQNVLTALRHTRTIRPGENNWLLFSGTIEAALYTLGAPDWDAMRIDYAVRQHLQWYQGDGSYGDGAHYHWDYYNAFVIQPMLVDICRAMTKLNPWGDKVRDDLMRRAQRYAAVQERLISPEGTFPPIGRSLAYRFGALQGLAQAALLHTLPPEISPAQVREALTAVIHRMIEMPGTFDANGWLRIGFCGAQSGIGEVYISTGSLYLCAAGLLPLGLPSNDPFWSDPPAAWTSGKAWGGQAFPIDHAID